LYSYNKKSMNRQIYKNQQEYYLLVNLAKEL